MQIRSWRKDADVCRSVPEVRHTSLNEYRGEAVVVPWPVTIGVECPAHPCSRCAVVILVVHDHAEGHGDGDLRSDRRSAAEVTPGETSQVELHMFRRVLRYFRSHLYAIRELHSWAAKKHSHQCHPRQ